LNISLNMKKSWPPKIRSNRPHGTGHRRIATHLALVVSGGLMILALGMLAGCCQAMEPVTSAPSGAGRSTSWDSVAAEVGGSRGFDLVLVKSEGRGPYGYRFQIVFDSIERGAEGSLNLAAGEGAILVTARDIDGIGDDPDLIVKTAESFTPVGIWINDHHGGFVRADARIYAPSIWSESPQLASANSTGTLYADILMLQQSYTHPPMERRPGGLRSRPGRMDRPRVNALLPVAVEALQNRGPPAPLSTSFQL
jgi:hypothetical protein